MLTYEVCDGGDGDGDPGMSQGDPQPLHHVLPLIRLTQRIPALDDDEHIVNTFNRKMRTEL